MHTLTLLATALLASTSFVGSSTAVNIPEADPDLPVDARFARPLSTAVTLLNGTVTDKSTAKAVKGRVVFGDLRTGDTLMSSRINSSTGIYRGVLEAGKDYGIGVIAEGYIYTSGHYAVPEGAAYSEPTVNFAMTPIRKGERIELRNGIFSEGSAELIGPMRLELTMLAAFLEANPSVRIEINCAAGKGAREKKLATGRATAVRNYMESKLGITAGRVTTKGTAGKSAAQAVRIEAKIIAG